MQNADRLREYSSNTFYSLGTRLKKVLLLFLIKCQPFLNTVDHQRKSHGLRSLCLHVISIVRELSWALLMNTWFCRQWTCSSSFSSLVYTPCARILGLKGQIFIDRLLPQRWNRSRKDETFPTLAFLGRTIKVDKLSES